MKREILCLAAGFLLGTAMLAGGSQDSCRDFARDCLAPIVDEARGRAWFGAEMHHHARELGRIKVRRVAPASPAAAAGIAVGDRIVGVDDLVFSKLESFAAIDAAAAKLFTGLQPGKSIEIHIERGPSKLALKVAPVAYEGYALAEFLGLRLMQQFPDLVGEMRWSD